LIDPDTTLRSKLVEFVERGEFGLGYGKNGGGKYERVWFKELVAREEISFEPGVVLLTRSAADALTSGGTNSTVESNLAPQAPLPSPVTAPELPSSASLASRTVRVVGAIPPELWNRLGTKLIPKLRSGSDLKLGLEFSVSVQETSADGVASEIRQILDELGIGDNVRVEQ